ncbi:SDR family NAD(P)-dependent oxidoreductase [Kitasatospora purpeofusca]|uniref:SDR family NAD(P)-dependent oxidoreductase n=1 Tax=Kitasatospora purpeofusca TaxID=67352 RepID=UPI0030F200F7
MTTHVGSVIVTGASSGFGRATAALLASHGRRVVAVARRVERLRELSEECGGGGSILPLALDVRDARAVSEAVATLPEDFADIGALVNNAGLSRGFGPVQSADPRHWQEMVETNITGQLNCIRAVLPRLVESGAGHVVNIGSVAGVYPYSGGNVYSATKAFTHQLSLSMRTDLEGTGVRVSCVAPGMARTEFADVRYDGDKDRVDALYDGVEPLAAADVAEAVHWCLARPSRVNVNMIEIMPTSQPFGLGFRSPATRKES